MLRAIDRAIEQMPMIGEWGMTLSRSIHNMVLSGGKPMRKVADLLHGTWLGHPLHATITDFTVGAWFLGGFFDLIAMLTGSRKATWAGDRLVEAGTALAVPTALSGMADYSTAQKPAVKTATLHATLNAAGFALCTASILARRRGHHPRGWALSGTALGLTLASAWLGGKLVYKHRVGVDHGEHFSGPSQWTPVLDEQELSEGTPRRVEIEDGAVLLYRENGQIHAVAAVCPHAGGPLEEGQFRDGCVQCPWHDSVFRLRDGNVVHGPSTRPLSQFHTRIHDGRIEVRLAEANTGAPISSSVAAKISA